MGVLVFERAIPPDGLDIKNAFFSFTILPASAMIPSMNLKEYHRNR
jgi:hypothetical protein